MDIVGAFACSHAGLIVTRRDRAAPEQRDAVYGAYAAVRDAVAALRPDAILILATDHTKAFPLSHVPAFTIGVGPVARGLGDGGLAPCEVPVHQLFAKVVLEGGVERGVDLAFSEDVAVDHSFVMPLSLVTPDLDVPVVPLTQNCNVPPRPTFERSYEVGARIRAAIQAGPPGRLVVIGTGGLSHWVGSEERRAFMRRDPGTRLPDAASFALEIEDTGPVNADFDRAFLAALRDGAAMPFVRQWTADAIEELAGNGVHEIRNWLTVAGIVADAAAETLAYEPVAEWLTGTAVARFLLPEAAA